MPRNWDDAKFATWAAIPSDTQQQKCDNAVRAIREAIDLSTPLAARSLSVFAQGSYRNRTDVRNESDVDICVLYRGTFFFDLPSGVSPQSVGASVPADYTFDRYRPQVLSALVQHFGAGSVRSGTKAITVQANTYRVIADVVPCFEYHWYHTA